jgi:hypothetical protein
MSPTAKILSILFAIGALVLAIAAARAEDPQTSQPVEGFQASSTRSATDLISARYWL